MQVTLDMAREPECWVRSLQGYLQYSLCLRGVLHVIGARAAASSSKSQKGGLCLSMQHHMPPAQPLKALNLCVFAVNKLCASPECIEAILSSSFEVSSRTMELLELSSIYDRADLDSHRRQAQAVGNGL